LHKALAEGKTMNKLDDILNQDIDPTENRE